MAKKRKIALIVDLEFGSKLLELYTNIHCWIIQSEGNQPYIDQVLSTGTHMNCCWEDFGITPFLWYPEDSLAEILNSGLDNVWDHHVFEADAQLIWLDIYGVGLNEYTKTALFEFGFEHFSEISGGISAWKGAV
ncbi:hypothetical protein K4H28_00485 [Deefgea tanakiae]|uniref:Uncharacterized protein n=1 Tax=Deefgea tanakiae TaxID=2865840 RepID=A0ABX8Z5V5_9NEIS|nr:hypothetical protein [Deefgea tanakiae]QZA77956.1 hypothetical protein K4H28_00485 [Deefgea tanakiae]